MSPAPSAARAALRCLATAGVLLSAACAESGPAEVQPEQLLPDAPATTLQALDCVATVSTGAVSCGAPASSGASRTIIGGQNDYVRLTSSNISNGGGVFQMDVTVQNLLPEGIGTPDGVVVDTAGIKVFFFEGPTTKVGPGTVSVANADGMDVFLGAEQSFFRYPQKLAKNEVSAPKTWQFVYDPGVESFTFKVYVAAEVQPLLVINEVLPNPGGTISDASGEWFEVHNAGRLPVQMQGMMVADSSAPQPAATPPTTGRRPYHVIASSLLVPPGGYVVLGNTTNTVNNGGVPVDYAYGSALALVNSVDAVKIARVHNIAGDTLTLDRVFYIGLTTAQNGVSRELKDPALDNHEVMGANWADPLVTAIYGPGGRGTPKAQNSTFTP